MIIVEKNIILNFLNKLHYNSPLPNNDLDHFKFIKEIWNIEKIQFFSRKELDQYQNYKFKKLIIHSYNNVHFYKKWFREQNLSLNDFKSLNDIRKLPILTKELIRNNFNDFIALNANSYKPQLLMTSGSTGIPFRFYVDKRALIKERASFNRQWRLYGIKSFDRTVVLRGTLVHKYNEKNDILWEYTTFHKTLHLNTFHMSEKNCIKIIQKILKFKPRLFRVYPMALYILAQYIKKYNIKFPSLKLIHFSSESYTPIARAFIKQQFNCPILDRYGQSEIVLNAFECQPEKGYHVEEENNILELLDNNNDQVNNGESGRIVGTNLHNYSMPLIRYSTEDLAIMGSSECECGRHTKKLDSIQGRVLDQIITKDGSLVSGISFYHYWKHEISEKIPNVSYVQVIQPKLNEIIVKILPNKNYSERDEKIISNELSKFIGHQNISFKYIDKRPDGEKWRFTVSKLSSNQIKKLF